MLNAIGETCGFSICLLLLYFTKNKFSKHNFQYTIFIFGLRIITVNILICLSRVIIQNYFNKEFVLLYITTLLFHISNCILMYIFTIYCITLIPRQESNMPKIYKQISIPYIFLIGIIITSQFTKVFYYIDGETIKCGPLLILSFICAFTSLTIVLCYVFFIHRKQLMKSTRTTILLIFFFPSVFLIIEMLCKTIILSGFSYSCVMLIMFFSFYSNTIDTYSGFTKRENYHSFIKSYVYKETKFSLFFIRINNLETLKNIYSSTKTKIFLSKLIKEITNLKVNFEIFYIEDNTFVLVTNVSKLEEIGNISDILKSELVKEINDAKNNIYVDYSGFVFINDKINYNVSIEHLLFLESNKNEFLKQNDIKIFTNRDFKKLDEKMILLKNIIKIVDKFKIEDIKNEETKLDVDDVLVYFQPIYNNEKNKFLSAEALMRLNINELGGIVYPDKFISYMEEKNFIHKFSCIVLIKTCMFIKQLELEHKEVDGISVNFSIMEFVNENFEEDILKIVKTYNVEPSKIHIEMTESLYSNEIDIIKNKMLRLKNYGFKFYLDDFGTGYSNFSKLVDFPFDVIKFDKSLIDKSLVNEDTRELVDCLSTLLKKKNIKILYEGIEDEDGKKLMEDLNVNFAQGYKYSKPIPHAQAIEFFK